MRSTAVQVKRWTGREQMKKQSWLSGSKGLALAGSAAAVVLVLLGLVFSAQVAPPEDTVTEEVAVVPQAPAPQPDAPAVALQEPAAPEVANAQPETVTEQAAEAAPEGESAPQEDLPAATDTEAAETGTTETEAAETGTVVQSDEASTPAPDADPSETAAVPAEVSPETNPTPAAQSDPAMPSFDTVRLAPDGEAVVAGRAMAGSTVNILLDGAVVGTAMTGGDGAFAAFLSLPPSDAPRVLTLAVTQDGTVVASDQQVIIAPVQPADVAVAADTSASDEASPQAAPDDQTATAAPALLLSDNTGVRVLQPATPADPSRIAGIALDVISYTSEGDVLLQGRATATSNILIYLDNAAVTSARVAADGIWSTGLPGVAPGIYTLRLDEVDASGKVLSRIETPFKREDRDEVAAIAAANAPSPTTAAPDAGTRVAQTGAAQPAANTGQTAAGQTTSDQTASDQAAAIPAPPTVRVVTVQPGNTLWAIARESYGEGPLFVRVFEANRDRIRDPDLIYPGQIFEIPE
jgi:LysM repeat protein